MSHVLWAVDSRTELPLSSDVRLDLHLIGWVGDEIWRPLVSPGRWILPGPCSRLPCDTFHSYGQSNSV